MYINIEIENFKSIVSTKLELQKGLNILIGQNGAGKTCTLYSLKFIKDILTKGVGLAMARGGGPSRIYHRGKRKITFRIKLDYGERVINSRKRDTTCYWTLSVEQKGREKIATISYEGISIDCEIGGNIENVLNIEIDRKNVDKPISNFKLNTTVAGKDILDIRRNRFDRKKEYLFENMRVHIEGILAKLKKNGDKSLLSILWLEDRSLAKLFSFFSSLNEYNIIPERARQATEQLPYSKMESNGFGISEVIYALEKRNFHKLSIVNEIYDIDDYEFPIFRDYYFGSGFMTRKDRKNIESAFGRINRELSAAVKPISNVSVKIDNSTGRRYVVFNTSKNTFYPDEVSDGTIKWLCIVTSIYVGFSNIYLLEEPENFLHPWMQQKLIQIMRDQAHESDTIFLLTSHSITLLNGCNPNEIRIVESTKDGTKIKSIEEEEEITGFLKNSDFRLGDLWVSGGIGAVPQ
ncbi:AAA family ATPase [Compostibacter hankyongensis]|uniref:Endonuclease GajA/Old nuclease/RecF-like AAA domain-containing protein n=1 Tax=Compostibacter hankyongensis TaxID=1007089 RepID=A0ABP8G4I7_9BACT